ncbi:hypothetical protein AA313_de0204643 [Arthrobotrys entomopaga]|nr:hypothetical protein AA313_de0204643 [Arthrobotrys entomopaga]
MRRPQANPNIQIFVLSMAILPHEITRFREVFFFSRPATLLEMLSGQLISFTPNWDSRMPLQGPDFSRPNERPGRSVYSCMSHVGVRPVLIKKVTQRKFLLCLACPCPNVEALLNSCGHLYEIPAQSSH